MEQKSADAPVVSVIVPVYNAERYLRETLDCICNQTLNNIEIILVDDGSVDGSLAILKEYAAKDSRITILQQKNQFAGVARNNGMDVAQGKYLSFLDADDRFEPRMYSTMVDIAEREQSDIVFCNADVFNEQTGKTEPRSHFCNLSFLKKSASPSHFCPQTDAADYAFYLSSPAPWNKLFRKTFVERHGLRYAPFKSSNDLEFVLSAFAHAMTVSACTDILVHYRLSPDSISHTKKGRSSETCMLAYESLKKRLVTDGIWNRFKASFNIRYCNTEVWHLKTLSRNDSLAHIITWRERWESVFNLLEQENSWLRYEPNSAVFYQVFDPPVIFITKTEQQLQQLHDIGLTDTRGYVSFVHEGMEENMPPSLTASRAWNMGRIHCVETITDTLLAKINHIFPSAVVIESYAPADSMQILNLRVCQLKKEFSRSKLLAFFPIGRSRQTSERKRKLIKLQMNELKLCLKALTLRQS